MNKTAQKIKLGLAALTYQPNELISGTVVAGSQDEGAGTVTVQPSDDGGPIEGVSLTAVTGDANGITVVPADGSSVVIGSIDGPGEWTVVKTSDIIKATVKIGPVTCMISNNQIVLQNNNVLLNLSDSLFKMNTASENLYQFLHDLITYITTITVPTSTGPSGVPVNSASFNTLLTRLNNLLTH